ncbi:MAG: hypothetical protein JWN06_539 [Propionibacteriaceae bacterium]|jgi:hypothetical protein|nr:hypothetical protein [Propionibacteriaceae bacterium]
MMFSSGATLLDLDADGQVRSVSNASLPDQCRLRGAAVSEVVIAGQVYEVGPPEQQADADEVELSYLVADRLRIVVRHTFAAGWGLRIAFSTVDRAPLVLDDVTVTLRPGPDQVGWALAAGAEASYAALPPPGRGPLLAGVLQLGSVERVTSDGLQLGRIELAGTGRYVVQWHWDWYDTPLDFARSRHPTIPASLFAVVGEILEMGRDDDAALIVSGDLEMTETDEQLELASDLAGSYEVEQRSARGTTRVALRWVPTVEEIICDRAEAALLQPRTGAGLVRLARLPDAMVMQYALAQALVSDTDDAAEALDLFTARLTADEPAGETDGQPLPLVAAYLSGEYARTGEQDLLDRAVEIILGARSAAPGLGIAALQVCLALMLTGRPVEPILRHLSKLSEASGEAPGDATTEQQIAALELIAVTWAADSPPANTRPDRTAADADDLSARVESLGRWFGAGLKGGAVEPLPLEQAAQLSTVLQLLPDGAAGELRSRWGCSPQSLAGRVVPELVARLDFDGADWAHVWLMLGQQPR